MRIVALLLIAAGVLFIVPSSFDFAIALRRGWHATVFPSPPIGAAFIILGVVALLASLV
jgi:hypothetical protein